MAIGDDSTPDWINSSHGTPGHDSNTLVKDFANPGLTTTLTAQFQVFCSPTVGAQKFTIDFVNAGSGDDVLGIEVNYEGTGSGGVVSAVVYDTGDDSGGAVVAVISGIIANIKVTYDGSAVRFYANNVLTFTWTHVLDHAISLISRVYAKMEWFTGPGGTMQMKGLTLEPGLL